MNGTNNKGRIGRAFHRQAEEYDQHASVQKRVITCLDRLIASNQLQAPTRVLDIGCGTGALLSTLQDRYPMTSHCGLDLAFNMLCQSARRLNRSVIHVNADAEKLPFKDGVFDLVVSASTLQWVEGLDTCFKECCRVLGDGGLLCVAFFAGSTLWELRESYKEAVTNRFGVDDNRVGRVHRFRDPADVQAMLSDAGFDQVMITTETEMEYHDDVPDLLRSIKAIGAATVASNNMDGGLGWRGLLNDMAGAYRSRFRNKLGIPATYDVMYLVARRRTDG